MKPHPSLLVVAIVLSAMAGLQAQNTCLTDGIAFTSQAQIDSFPINFPGCTVIEGDVYIREKESGDIIRLDSLYPITAIKGYLSIGHGDWPIYGNDSLSNLRGLHNLTSITGFFGVFGNAALVDFHGLESLTSVGAGFWVHENDALTSFSGLESLVSVATLLDVRFNNSLTNFKGLEKLTVISGDVVIWDNEALTSLNGLDNLSHIESGLSLINNDALTSLNGLEGLTSFFSSSASIFLSDNDALANLRGLDNLTSVPILLVRENKGLTSLSGLENLLSIVTLQVVRNDQLTSLKELKNLASIEELSLRENAGLSDCAIQPICDYLENGGESEIRDNAPGCKTRLDVEDACGILMLDDAVQLFPSPTSGIIQIIIPEYTEWEVSIWDSKGRTFIRPLELTNEEIDLSNLPSGLYFLELNDGRHSIIKRILKQ